MDDKMGQYKETGSRLLQKPAGMVTEFVKDRYESSSTAQRINSAKDFNPVQHVKDRVRTTAEGALVKVGGKLETPPSYVGNDSG